MFGKASGSHLCAFVVYEEFGIEWEAATPYFALLLCLSYFFDSLEMLNQAKNKNVQHSACSPFLPDL